MTSLANAMRHYRRLDYKSTAPPARKFLYPLSGFLRQNHTVPPQSALPRYKWLLHPARSRSEATCSAIRISRWDSYAARLPLSQV